ncbi:MAG: AAA family ATPase [Halanaerobiales bacterium]|nr:AAA family ATPase [Halanaerobiales bacterium]
MEKKYNVVQDKLKCLCDPEIFSFESTAELKPFKDGIIGQKRAVNAIDTGMRIDQEGYNIYISGVTGSGRSTYANTIAERKSSEKKVPNDLCYVFNFDNPEKPKALSLPPGTGIRLDSDMENIIKDLKEEIPEVFQSDEYDEARNKIMSQYQEKSNSIMEEFDKKINKEGFTLQNTASGTVPVPIDEDGNTIKQEAFQKFNEEKKSKLREKSQQIQNDMEKMMREIRELKSEAQKKLKEMEKKLSLNVIEPRIKNLQDKYSDVKEIVQYLEKVKYDITQNLDKFKDSEDQSQKQKLAKLFEQKDDSSFFIRYKVNLLINNKDTEGAPVIVEHNPTFYNLFGKIEAKSQFGTLTTDFTMIKSGDVHEANGGYLIMKVKDLLTKPFAWETLKRVLINHEIIVENIGEQYRSIPISGLKPEGIPIDIKIILIGDPYIYQLLYHYDEEFKKLFKIRADFDYEMKRNKNNMKKFASFLASICRKESLNHFTPNAVAEVIEYSSKMSEDKDKMTAKFNQILEVIYEANSLSEKNNRKLVQKQDVQQAIEERIKRANLIEDKILEKIKDEQILINVKGKETGQINGLSVYQTGQYSFGRPTRITAQTFMGQEGIINIEREADMSGNIHNKAVLIFSGYLGNKYAQDTPLSLNASLAFEQSYGGIDGDSATAAELIAILSSISEFPLKQNLAITGSMNQKGKIQPIGGVNEKIEGFYKVCKDKDISGQQGVVIPEQNINNLMLKDEIIQEVKKDKFHIYSVSNIDEAIEIMFDKPSDEVHQKVKKVMKEKAEKAAKLKAEDKMIGK